ncbi:MULTISPECIES: hypothetical protein [unclassified Bradyrhizobium]|uniref:hypothetical protein n=1 Tax=unclassified Bradyrhizobium TaxID=2631580 RepID=UPI002915E7DB|nr:MULTISPECIES: hypothetical protein [unclassified Bradyrhizobium]
MTYPITPGSKSGGASRHAGKKIAGRAKTLRAAIENLLLPGYRLTADEIADRLRETPFAIRPRCTELVKSGVLVKTKDRRPNASGMAAHLLRHKDRETEVALPAPEPVLKISKSATRGVGRIKRASAVHADQNALFG